MGPGPLGRLCDRQVCVCVDLGTHDRRKEVGIVLGAAACFGYCFVFKYCSLVWLCWVSVAARGLSLASKGRGGSLVAVHALHGAMTGLVAEHRLECTQAQ